MPLTDLAIRQAKGREKKYKLSAGNGLCLLVTPEGAKYWRLRYRFGDKQKELSVGRPYPETGLRDAQAEAARLRLLVADGIDPAEQRIATRLARREAVANTFGEAANAWHAHRARAWKERTNRQVRDYLDKDLLPKLGRRPLASITAPELADLVAGIEKRGSFDVAKKARQWLRAIYSYARAKGWIGATVDPARDLNALAAPGPMKQNFAHVTLGELPELLRKLDAYPGSQVVKACAWLSLWSANRPGVTRTLRWSELKLDEAVWVIEEGREGMKRGYFHVTPLPRHANQRTPLGDDVPFLPVHAQPSVDASRAGWGASRARRSRTGRAARRPPVGRGLTALRPALLRLEHAQQEAHELHDTRLIAHRSLHLAARWPVQPRLRRQVIVRRTHHSENPVGTRSANA